jgi:large subunit ribosomal protein L22
MQATARGRFVSVAPRKARRVVDLIRGIPIADARRVLAQAGLGAGTPVRKVLDSAVANAENAGGVADNLIVRTVTVDEGPTLRRFRPRALGRATRIRKRTSHITVVVESVGEVPVGAED